MMHVMTKMIVMPILTMVVLLNAWLYNDIHVIVVICELSCMFPWLAHPRRANLRYKSRPTLLVASQSGTIFEPDAMGVHIRLN